jgi:hypothetical protein
VIEFDAAESAVSARAGQFDVAQAEQEIVKMKADQAVQASPTSSR